MKIKRYNVGVILLLIAITIPVICFIYILFLISPIIATGFTTFIALFMASIYLIQTG